MKEVKKSTPSQIELCNNVNDILYHIIWSIKKIKRNELWVAVTTINTHIHDLLLKMIEAYNQKTANSSIMYDGRFLEVRTDWRIIEKMKGCFSKYDEIDAVNTLKHVFDFTFSILKTSFRGIWIRFKRHSV